MLTQPYLYDRGIFEKSTVTNLTGDRNGGLRVGTVLVRDQLMEEAHNIRMKEVYQTSVFAKNKRSPRGVMRGAIQLARGPNGGFYNSKSIRTEFKNELEDLLLKQAKE